MTRMLHLRFDELERHGRPPGDPFSLGEKYDDLLRPTVTGNVRVGLPHETEPSTPNHHNEVRPVRLPRRWPTIPRVDGNALFSFDVATATAVMRDPNCYRIVANDGRTTYAAKSLPVSEAHRTFEGGFRFYRGILTPHFANEALLLAVGTRTKQQHANVKMLASRYGTCDDPAQLVFGFPEPNPGTDSRHHFDPFSGTYLGETSQYIQKLPDGTYLIPFQYIVGYYDQTACKFVHNPGYWDAIPEELISS